MRLRLGNRERGGIAVLWLAALFLLASWAAAADQPAAAKGTYRLTVEIDAPADFVFPYLINEDLIDKWNHDASVEVTFPKGVEPRVGKQIRVSLQHIPTQPWILLEITKLEPGKLVLTKFIDGVLAGEFEYRLEPRESGKVMLIHEMRIKPVGALTTIVWEVLGKHVHRQKMRAFLDNIKQVVEAYWARRSAPISPAAK